MSSRTSNPSGEGSESAVRDRLDRVTDPELDRSIVELDYIDRIDIEGGRVSIAITLPTAWCSPAFAWMMLADAREEVEALPWVDTARVRLRDHMHGEEITEGVNSGASFAETFPDATGGIEDVRATLDDKARQARQHEAVTALLEAGLEPAQIVELTRDRIELAPDRIDPTPAGNEAADRAHVSVRDITVVVDREPIAAYLRKAEETGHVTGPDDRVFLTPEGEPIPLDRFEEVHRLTRLAGINMDGQGAVCEALNESRRAKLGRD